MKDKDKIEKLQSFNEKKYENIDLDHLIMYVMGQLNELKVNLSYENAVVAAFKLFPRKFSLLGYPKYPDSDRVMNCLNRCVLEDREWLGGKIKHGFIITDRSDKIIQKAKEMLKSEIIKKTKAFSQTRRKELILAEVVNSSAYKKYLIGEKDFITKAEVCYLLQGTLDSPVNILRENYDLLKNYVNELERKDILEFLKYLEGKFKDFLISNAK